MSTITMICRGLSGVDHILATYQDSQNKKGERNNEIAGKRMERKKMHRREKRCIGREKWIRNIGMRN